MGFFSPDFTRRLQNHPALQPGEIVRHAGYGLGYGTLALADRALGTVRQPDERDWLSRGGRGAQPAAGTRPALRRPLMAMASRAVTNKRLLFFAKRTVIGTPRAVSAACRCSGVAGATYKAPMLAVHLGDGSTFSLHMPRNQGPDRLRRCWGRRKKG